MSRDFTDDIDDCCDAILGHTNWGFADIVLHKTVETIMSKRYGDSPKSDRIEYVVIFYKEPQENEDD
tara:strand:+ start:1591 stop:1791 length:201 start_codon:yes stop_codon:yes gene_type:complete